MNNQKTDALLQIIELKYKSFEKPDFSFVNETVEANPNYSIVTKLREMFVVEETTDLNDDVSFHYLLSTDGKQWITEFSMVGPYAIVLKILNDGNLELVTPNSSVEKEQKIISLLLENQIEILDQEILEYPCPLKLFNAEPVNVSIYQALFSDTDILPWKFIS